MALFETLLNKKSSNRKAQNEASSTPSSRERATFADSNGRFRQRRPAIHAPQPRGHELFSAFAPGAFLEKLEMTARLTEINFSEERRAQGGQLPPLTSRPTEQLLPLPNPSVSQKDKDSRPSPTQQPAEAPMALSDAEEIAAMHARFASLAVDCLPASGDVSLENLAMLAVQTFLDEQYEK